MSTVAAVQRSPIANPLDEAVWQAWVLNERRQDRRNSAARIRAVRLVSIVGLLAVAGLWPYVTPYEIAIKFVVTAAAAVLMFQAFQARHYAFAAVSGALAPLYNPVAPVFGLSGEWQRAVVAASATPFITSLALRSRMVVHND